LLLYPGDSFPYILCLQAMFIDQILLSKLSSARLPTPSATNESEMERDVVADDHVIR
jgi:hypothetical protein